MRFEFEGSDVGVRGPRVSLDGGRTWSWLGGEAGDEKSFSYRFRGEAPEVRFSLGMPYTESNLVEFPMVPFVDKDGVEEGDQGKSRRPHDHSQDYAAPCLYPEVRALRELVPGWSGRKLRMALGLHCPGHRGEVHERIHFVGMADERRWRRVGEFSEMLERVRRGPLPYHKGNNLAFGEDWNTEAAPPGEEPKRFSDWMVRVAAAELGVTLEVPYANAQGAAVTGETARGLGRDLAAAIQKHLAE